MPVDPVEKIIAERGRDIGSGFARMFESRSVGLVEALRWRYWGGFPRLGYRRGRVAAWEKRARCGITISEVIDSQDAGSNGTLGPSAQTRTILSDAQGPTPALPGVRNAG